MLARKVGHHANRGQQVGVAPGNPDDRKRPHLSDKSKHVGDVLGGVVREVLWRDNHAGSQPRQRFGSARVDAAEDASGDPCECNQEP